MSPRWARVVLAVSCAALAMVVLVAASGTRDDRSADLVGEPTDPARRTASTVTPSPPDAPAVVTPPPADPISTGVAVPPPVGLRIASLDVDAQVLPVGTDEDGELEIPDATHVGWYRAGVAPGAPAGSAVLTAHVDYDGRPGVFLRLSQLELGSEVVAVDRTGVERRYVVTERYQVDKEELDVDELFRRDGPATLTLITCGGVFEERARHYRDNIVVRAVPV